MKKIIKVSAAMLLAACVLLWTVELVQAAASHYTKSMQPINPGSGRQNALRGLYTFAASRDTVFFPFNWTPNAIHDATVGIIGIETELQANATATDSMSISVRYDISYDNFTTYQRFTLGTDSTSFTGASISPTAYQLINFAITQATHFGVPPYSRVVVWGKSTYNLIGNKVRVTVNEQ